MSNWGGGGGGGAGGGRPKSWASGLRPVARDKGHGHEPPPQSGSASEEKEYRFLMGQSFMGGGLDGLMGESSSSSSSTSNKRPHHGDESQEAVDNMLSNILKKTKTELKNVNPSLLDSSADNLFAGADAAASQQQQQQQQQQPPVNSYYQNQFNPYDPYASYGHNFGGGAYSAAPPYAGGPSNVLFVDITQPPPPIEPHQNSNSPSTPKPAEPSASSSETKIQRKWGNILKPSNDESSSSTTSRRDSESNLASPSNHDGGSESPSASNASPWRSPPPSSSFSSKAIAEPAVVEEELSNPAAAPYPKFLKPPYPSKFKDMMSFDVDPVNMTYCGKEFIDIVDVPGRLTGSAYGEENASRAVCHLCQLSDLMPSDLAVHLDGEKHYKNLRTFVMEKEYETYSTSADDPAFVAAYPDFNTYMLRRYPSRLEEYFEKVDVIDEATMKTRCEFQIKYKPTKMLLDERKKEEEKKNGGKSSKKTQPTEKVLSECPYCADMLPLHAIANHKCDAMQASENTNQRTGKGTGQPMGSWFHNLNNYSAGVPKKPPPAPEEPPEPIPADAVDVQLKLYMCVEYQKLGQCQYGKKCVFAHKASDLNTFTYRRTKTQMCRFSKPCIMMCGKAHSKDELMISYKTALCRSHVQLGSCQHGEKCQFAHGMNELRSPWDSQPLAFGGSKGNETTGDVIVLSPGRTTSAAHAQPKKVDAPATTSSTSKPKIKLTLSKKL